MVLEQIQVAQFECRQLWLISLILAFGEDAVFHPLQRFIQGCKNLDLLRDRGQVHLLEKLGKIAPVG